jgi:hypothetical protein
MDAITLVECLSSLPNAQAVLIRGDHGIGKSDLVKTLAANQKKELIDVRASTMQEGDAVGYPDLAKIQELGVSCFALPSWYVRACNEGVVLFLDELNRGLIGVLNGMFQIVLDRELGNGHNGKPTRLHPDTQVIAAVNVGPGYTVNEIDPALLSRFWVVDFKPTIQDWIEWGKGPGGINTLILEFVNNNPAHLRPTKEIEPGKKAPDQRAWAMLNRTLAHNGIKLDECGGNPPKMLYPISLGYIGVEASAALVEFVKNYESIITAADVLDRWDSISDKVVKLTTEKKLTIVEKIKDINPTQTFTNAQGDNLVKFFKTLTGECKLVLFNAILNGGNIKNLVPFHSAVGKEILTLIQAAHEKNESAKK